MKRDKIIDSVIFVFVAVVCIGAILWIIFGADFGLEHPKLYTIAELCGEEEE